jgi:hypothetical protein
VLDLTDLGKPGSTDRRTAAKWTASGAAALR